MTRPIDDLSTAALEQHAQLEVALFRMAKDGAAVRTAAIEALHAHDQAYGLDYDGIFDVMSDFVWALIADRFAQPAQDSDADVARDILLKWRNAGWGMAALERRTGVGITSLYRLENGLPIKPNSRDRVVSLGHQPETP